MKRIHSDLVPDDSVVIASSGVVCVKSDKCLRGLDGYPFLAQIVFFDENACWREIALNDHIDLETFVRDKHGYYYRISETHHNNGQLGSLRLYKVVNSELVYFNLTENNNFEFWLPKRIEIILTPKQLVSLNNYAKLTIKNVDISQEEPLEINRWYLVTCNGKEFVMWLNKKREWVSTPESTITSINVINPRLMKL